ncbi:MAG: DUF2161 family putative PD-(D/E)XK-type phosphodiesterase [Spirochaetes bacterium]|nr:DUF2161 family putative PD-(D/E)XK-type phosphodiesterase [Spirochaetota bacterium]
MKKMKETELFLPIKSYLEAQGYQVNCEVNNCDIVATKKTNMIIVELKKQFSVQLLIQAIKRQEICDSVYVAIAVAPGKRQPPNLGGILKILRRLELGLILVYFMKTKKKLEVLLHPGEYIRFKKHKKKRAIITEINGRFKEYNLAGMTVREERITAYKQQAIQIASILLELKTATPKELVSCGTSKKTQQILSQNYYGWFNKVKRGTYRLHEDGKKILQQYEDLVVHFKEEYDKIRKK